MSRLALLLPAVLLCATGGGCLARPSHPVTNSVTSAPSTAPPGRDAPEPGPPVGVEARRALYVGFADVEGPFAYLKGRPSGVGEVPRLHRLTRMEWSVRRRTSRGTALGRVRHVNALGFSGHAPLPPGDMADILGSPVAERHALGAEMFRTLGTTYARHGFLRRVFRVEFVDVGEGPFRFDLRFTTALERWDLGDGSILLRYDPLPVPAAEHITLYRGACLIEPAPGGSRVTEFIVLGTDISVPFFMEGSLRDLVDDTFENRVRRLWRLAAAKAARPR